MEGSAASSTSTPSRTLEELQKLLEVHKEELADKSWQRKCLFCASTLLGSRVDYFSHLFESHGFNAGNPLNIANIDEFLNILEKKMEVENRCLYCEKTFKSYPVLRQHMRKKKHLRISDSNSEYDRFYLINYTEEGKERREGKKVRIRKNEEEDEEGEAYLFFFCETLRPSWKEVGSGEGSDPCKCLLCNNISPSVDSMLNHCKTQHKFDLTETKSALELDFYSTLKLVNWIRATIASNKCIACSIETLNPTELSSHFQTDHSNSITLNKDSISKWSDERFMVPFDPMDPLLNELPDSDEENEES